MTDALDLAAAHVNGGRPAKALAALAPYLASHPQSPRALLLQARALSRLGRHAEAVSSARAAAAAAPSDPDTLTGLSAVLREAGRTDDALAAAIDACALAPSSAEAHVQRAEALTAGRRRHVGAAVDAAREAVRLRPDMPRARDVLGRALLRRGKHREAEVAFRDALRLRPDEPVFLNNHGAALLGLGRHREALEEFRAAARLDPTLDLARHNTERAVGNAVRAAFVVIWVTAVRLAIVLAGERKYALAALLAVAGTAVFAAVAWWRLPPAGRAYVVAYARLRAPRRRSVAVGAAAVAAVAAATAWAGTSRGEDAALAVLGHGVAACLALAVTTWRRADPGTRTTPLRQRFATVVIDAAGATFLLVMLGLEWTGLATVGAYLGFCDGVLGASPLRRAYGGAVVADARTGARIGLARGLLRGVVKVVLAPLAPFARLDARRRAPHDLLLRTVVVRPRR